MSSTGQTEGALPSSASAKVHCACPTCGHPIANATVESSVDLSPGRSRQFAGDAGSLSHPPAPAAAFESEMGAAEELKLLKTQIRDVRRVCEAIARGDFSQKVTVPVQDDDMVHLKDDINSMVDKIGQTAKEVTRVSQEFVTEGKLGGQVYVPDVEGSWQELITAINGLAASHTSYIRSVAMVTRAVVMGDLSQRMEVDAKGEILDLKNTVNGVVNQLKTLTEEITRVTLEVGSEGTMGGQAVVPNSEGVWEQLTVNVNRMSSNLADQVRSISEVMKAIGNGDLSKSVTVEARGEVLDLKMTVNSMVSQFSTLTNEVIKMSVEVGTDGKLGGQVVSDVQGVWKSLTENMNLMVLNLTDQLRSITEVTKAVGRGDLTKKITVNARGEILDLKDTVNGMTESMRVFADEVDRLTHAISTEDNFCSFASAKGNDLGGTWRDLTHNLSVLSANITSQVRTIAIAISAVARGDLTRKITDITMRGEVLDLVCIINEMIDRLALIATEVTKVARAVGAEGKLGVQAEAENAQGSWQEVISVINTMSGNLAQQVRAFTEVGAAAVNGDYSRLVTVEASGEIDILKTQINQVVSNLREATQLGTGTREGESL